MSLYLRILLIVLALFSCIYVIRKIRSSQLKIADSMFWFLLVAFVLLLSFFPNIAIWLATIIGIESPVNLVYLLMIIIALAKLFSLTLRYSQLNHKIEIVVEEISICKKQCKDKQNKKGSGDVHA